MSVIVNQKPRPQFRNTGQLAKTIRQPRPIVDALTVLSGAERIDVGRSRVYTAENQERIEAASEVFDLCEGLDMLGREELRMAFGDFAERVRGISERQKAMIGRDVAAG